MGTSENSITGSQLPKTEVGTILTYRSLLDADRFCEALLNDLHRVDFGDAYRDLGLTHVTFWIQRDPDAGVVMWEGADIDSFLGRFASSTNSVIARWRGQLRVLSGPEEAESFWDASRHRLFCWAADEEGAESEVKIYRGPEQVEGLRQMTMDFQADPALYSLFGRVRKDQGFTRVETWHQRNSEDLILTLLEANDLESAFAKRQAESNELDQRIMKMLRSTIFQSPSPPRTATLLARWHA